MDITLRDTNQFLARHEEALELIDNWRSHGAQSWDGLSTAVSLTQAEGYKLLRIQKQRPDDSRSREVACVMTSQGYIVRLSEILEIYKFAKRVRKSGRDWDEHDRRKCPSWSFMYSVSEITAAGGVHVGCSWFSWEELTRVLEPALLAYELGRRAERKEKP